MAPLRGWGPKGDRLRSFVPQGHWRTLTFLGALRCDGLTAPCVFDGPINGECFRAYVAQQLVPVLKPGDIVIMDNLGSHKAAVLRRMIRAAGARLWYLPPYSPDLNPINELNGALRRPRLTTPLGASRRAPADRELLGLATLFDQCPHPERHHSATCPGFRPILGIAIFWRDFSAAQRMRPPLQRRRFGLHAQISKPIQFVLQIALYNGGHTCNQTIDLFA